MQNEAIKSFCQMDNKTAKKKLKQVGVDVIGKWITDGKPTKTPIIINPNTNIGCVIACFDESDKRKIKNILH